MQYMLDTNICSFLMRGAPEQVLLRFDDALQGDCAVVISAVTYQELVYGATHPKAPRKVLGELEKFLLCVDDIVPLDAAAVACGARVLQALHKKGEPISINDSLIAGHAMTTGSVLVTNNMREFSRVEGLDAEDWTQPQAPSHENVER